MKELEKNELMEINGGFIRILVGIGIAAVANIINNWDDFKKGIMSAL